MDGDDTFEEFERVAMTGAATLSRAAEILIRNAQDGKVRATAQTAQATEDLQRRAEGQSRAAELYYAHATTEPGWVHAQRWRGCPGLEGCPTVGRHRRRAVRRLRQRVN